MRILANSEDPDEMLYHAAFYLGLYNLLRQKCSSEKKYNCCLEIITCDPSIYTMDYPKVIVSNWKSPLVHKGLSYLFKIIFQ